jgi:co-chaperonin GroES (HSP10)
VISHKYKDDKTMSEKFYNKNNVLDLKDLEKVTGGIIVPDRSKENTTEETRVDSKVGLERMDRSGDNPFFLHH